MSDKTCLGYKNYETSSIAVHLSNTRAPYARWTERAKEILGNDAATFVLANEIQESFFVKVRPITDNNDVFGSLLNQALSRVSWYEIAEGFVNTAKEDLAYAETQGKD